MKLGENVVPYPKRTPAKKKIHTPYRFWVKWLLKVCYQSYFFMLLSCENAYLWLLPTSNAINILIMEWLQSWKLVHYLISCQVKKGQKDPSVSGWFSLCRVKIFFWNLQWWNMCKRSTFVPNFSSGTHFLHSKVALWNYTGFSIGLHRGQQTLMKVKVCWPLDVFLCKNSCSWKETWTWWEYIRFILPSCPGFFSPSLGPIRASWNLTWPLTLGMPDLESHRAPK